MHGPIFHLANPFTHQHAIFHYAHENDLDDSMFQGSTNFQDAMSKIIDPDTKSHLYQYQKDLKIRNICERGDKLKIKQDLQKAKTEEEAREHAASSVAALAS